MNVGWGGRSLPCCLAFFYILLLRAWISEPEPPPPLPKVDCPAVGALNRLGFLLNKFR